MSEKKVRENAFDKLNDEQKAVHIPYYVHEGEMSRLDRINKRLWIILIVVFLAFVGTNVGWIIYESQFEEIYIEQQGETDGGGNNYFNGTGEVRNYYGESETNHQDSGEEGQFQESN